jgi:Family of unknown function (DUF6677)
VSESSSQAAAAAPPAWRAWVAAGLAWAVPGAGHFFLGRRGRSLVFLLLILVTVGIGVTLHGNLYRVVDDQLLSRLATLGAMGMGAPYFVLRYGTGYEGDIVSAGYEYGTAFILTAGLMNLLLVLDAWDIARGKKE